MTSAYPAPLDVLIPQAQQWTAELGEIPSRNKLMNQFKIGAKKAAQVRAALTAPDTSRTDTDPIVETGRRLHAVPDNGPDQPATEDTTPAAPLPDAVTEPGGGSVTADQVTAPGDPAPPPAPAGRIGSGWLRRMPHSWPLILLALPAFVAIWSGLGRAGGADRVRPGAPAARHRGRVHPQHRDHPADRGGDLRRVRAAGVAGRHRVEPCPPVRQVLRDRVARAGRGRPGGLPPDDRRPCHGRAVADHHGRRLPARGRARVRRRAGPPATPTTDQPTAETEVSR